MPMWVEQFKLLNFGKKLIIRLITTCIGYSHKVRLGKGNRNHSNCTGKPYFL